MATDTDLKIAAAVERVRTEIANLRADMERLRADMERLRADMEKRINHHTLWLAGLVVAATGIIVGSR